MSYKNKSFRNFARVTLALFMMNTVAPTLQFAFADSTQYYVDATGGNDANDGLTPGTAWQTITQVNSTSLLQGDTVSLLCGETWNESMTLNNTNGTIGLPITVNGYGPLCATAKPKIDSVNIVTSSNITLNNIELSVPTVGNSIDIDTSSSITLSNTTLTNGSGVCMNISNSSVVSVNGNTFSGCNYAINLNQTDAVINSNVFSTISQDAITLSGSMLVNITQNTFTNISQNGILYNQSATISQNTFLNTCTTGSVLCAAIRNNPILNGTTSTTITQNTINTVGSGISGDRNYGILAKNIDNATITYNNIVNAEIAVSLQDAHTVSVNNNSLLTSRAKTFTAIQTISGSTYGNTFNENSFLQKNADYPYIETRDEVAGSNMADTLTTANSNYIYPLYKPNTSYIRSVNFGGQTREYTKSMLDQFDASISKFEYFAYKPYTNTGSFATANLLSNPNFDIDATQWTTSADLGLSPTVSYNPSGSYSGGSATITPAGGMADRLWMTDDAVLSVTAGQTYLVTGYTKSATGSINLRGFLHASGNKNTVYSDRIAETYASASGRTFSFYMTIKTTAADAQFSLETSNQGTAYEIDSISLRRMNAVIKNNTANEVLIFSNTGAVAYNQGCPGGVPCSAYVDTLNVLTSWPVNIAPYTTVFTLWNNSTNILNVPTCSLNLSAGSVPTGQPVTATWNMTNSLSQDLTYATYTGSVNNEPVASSGSIVFIPPYDAVTTIAINSLNDVGPGLCSVQVTTTNTAPTITPSTTTGSEDAIQIDGTLLGVDLNPGDTVFFEQFGSNVSQGVLTVESSGSFQYFPNADFCGNDSFEFRAYDQLGHYADPVFQTLQVACVNDTPIVVNNTATGYATVPKLIDVIANDTDADTPYEIQALSIYGYTNPTNGTLTVSGNQLEYTGNVGFSGAESLQYSIIDQSGAISNTGTLTLNISIINTPPSVSNAGYTLNEDNALTGVLIGTDPESNPLTFTTTRLPTNGIVTVMANGNFIYTPSGNYFGSDSFDYRANDGSLNSNTGTITFTINPVADAPVAVADSYSVNQDTMILIPVMNNDTDVDSSALVLTGYTLPTNGTLVVSGTGFSYTPNSGYIGADSFAYALEDETNLMSNTVIVTLNITSTNVAPTANTGVFTTNEDTSLSSAVTGTDPEMSTLTYVLDVLPTNGSVTLSNTGAFTYVPTANYFGSDSFTFHVSDGVLVSSGALVNLTITSVNDAPIASPLSLTATGNSMANSGNVYIGSLSGSDIESLVTFSVATSPIYGVLNIASNGAFDYTPAMGYTGSDSFTFIVSDGIATSATTAVSITVMDNGMTASGGGSGTGSSGTGSSGTGSSGPGGGGGSTGSTPVIIVGGGGGGGAGSSQVFPSYNITPVKSTGTLLSQEAEEILASAPDTESPMMFVLYDPTGLLSQLFFMQRYLSGAYAPTVSGERALEDSNPKNIIDIIDTMEFDNFEGPMLLRGLARMFIDDSKTLSNPMDAYDYAISKVESISTESGSRMDMTQNYVIRLFTQQQKRYQEAIERDLLSKNEEELIAQ